MLELEELELDDELEELDEELDEELLELEDEEVDDELEDELLELEDELELEEVLLSPSATQARIVPVESLPLPCIPKLAELPGARFPFQPMSAAV